MYETIHEELLEFLDASPTAFHAADRMRAELSAAGYEELTESEYWNLKAGGKYFVLRNESSLIAFRLPYSDPEGWMIATAHTDSPSFKIKPEAEMEAEGMMKLNVEKYGGMLMNPWFDRPLTIGGRVIIREEDRLTTRLVYIDKDLMMIPSLAIHMDRGVNDGRALNAQKDVLPVYASKEAGVSFRAMIAKAAEVSEDMIAGMDLFLCNRVKGTVWGAADEFISSGRLDDLQCAYGCLRGFIDAAENNSSIPLLAVFDNEEVGSMTKQGADSTFLSDMIRRVSQALGKDAQSAAMMVANSFMISADNAHAVHPNYPEKADPTNRPKINGGIVIKHHANQKYTTDAVSDAVLKSLCEKAEVPFQSFANRSDANGGSTLGNISNTHLSLNTGDIGLAQWAMHSPYETAGIKDTAYLARMMQIYFACSLKDEGYGIYSLK